MTTTSVPPSTSIGDLPVRQVMHAGYVSCRLETPLASVARLMAERRVHCIVGFGDATADDTTLWGLVSDVDVVAALAVGHESLTAGEIAATEVVTVTPDETIRVAAGLMRDHAVSHLLVVERRAERPVGILSTLDIAALMGHVQLPGVAAPDA